MVRKKLDNRIRTVIDEGVQSGHRSLFVVVGDKARDQIVILHHILSKATVAARPSILWCYKKELGFSSHRKKRMKEVQKKIKSGKLNVREDDPFELFIASTHIRYCYYAETHKILGNTHGMVVLQDFEALTPNLLARTIETVEGGGLVVLLLRTVNSLRQLYTIAMDVHSRYRTESHREVVARFNERFILSLGSCAAAMVVDDQLNVLPISSHTARIEQVAAKNKNETTTEAAELQRLKESMQDTQPIGALLNKCRTACQAKALLRLLDVITEKTLKATCSITAARGRGKSAALGLAVAGAVGFGYSNIFVTSPSPENLKTLFEFVTKGFDAMDYQEHMDYELIQSLNPEFNKAVVRINIFRDHRQTVQYIHPSDAAKLGQAELVVIDEAAAIPLPLVKQLMGPYLVFLASTINGYEGTGRSLSLKLLQQLREQAVGNVKDEKGINKLTAAAGRQLHELTLEESIRYKPGDQVEAWLNRVLCLDATSVHRLVSGTPPPQDCELYYINRDTLFSFHRASEAFLQRLMSIYVAAHYKNSPNDLQMLSDAPAHHLFALMGPIKEDQAHLPEVLVVVQVCLEGDISRGSVDSSMQRGKRAAGDLIPWTIAQQFQDSGFPALSGARIVRIAVHPDYQNMGYGSRALELLRQYYDGEISCLNVDARMDTVRTVEDADTVNLLEEQVGPRADLPSLLLRLTERPAEPLDYLGVSYGLTLNLLKFWKKAGYVPVYLRQTPNDLTGEHTCIMLKTLHQQTSEEDTNDWLRAYWTDFRRRFVSLCSFEFAKFTPHLALSMLQNKKFGEGLGEKSLTREELAVHLTNADLKRLEQYARNMVDHHLITDLLPTVARLYFTGKISSEMKLNAAQAAIILGVGLQHKSADAISAELDLPVNQLLAMFNKAMRKFSDHFNGICAAAIERNIGAQKTPADAVRGRFEPTPISLEDDLNEAAEDIKRRQERDRQKMQEEVISGNLKQFTIRGTDDDWESALNEVSSKAGVRGIVSVKTQRKEDGAAAEIERLMNDGGSAKSQRKRKRKSFKDR